ncbi:uncharacterized protein DSM5745_02176 [Aspergillus mulundensis]|uniref:Protein ZIP4 homolog n=1 Tax=Aspergillus mulundensis TaxID=1810919 RepID=A0A3D8SW64_9EURO|nr:Uncharacterized protein DSM5745_02176 [Aspergillus mulundensis]RDW90401.1 Uncharacterized protein DSM5745_02176 [Aspergillus mulundensis]
MAAKHSIKLKDQLQAILALAAGLHNQLTQNDVPGTTALNQETLELLEKTLRRLPLVADSISPSTRRQLDNEGTKLWNIRLLQLRTTDENNDAVLLCKVRALAYSMLDAAAPTTGPGNYRSLELSFKVVKACIEHDLISLAQKMMESAAARLDLIERSKPDTEIVKSEIVATEYYMLRVYLAWAQKRLHIADHMFTKIPESKSTEQQRVIVDICYTIGESALKAGQFDKASTWLARALKVCEMWPSDISQDVALGLKDKRLLVLHAYARSNLHLTTAASQNELRRALDLLRTEYGDSFPVLVFSLEVLNKDAPNEEYFETLKYSIKEMGDDDAGVKMRVPLPQLFVEACGQLLSKLAALDLSTKEQWMEKIFVSVIWTLTGTGPSEDKCPRLAEAAAQVLTDCGLSKPSEDATQASLILIWKYIDTMLSKGSTSTAEQWCRFLLQQPMFKQAPDIETKSFRKLILCVLEKYDPSTARQVFDEIPDDCKSCPLTLYLMYRLALLADDASLAIIYIQLLCRQGAEATYIWSCVADALQLGKTCIALQSLEGVMAALDDSGFGRLQIPQLLLDVICAVRENTANHEDSLGPVSSLLESALTAADTGQREPFSSDELRWLACKSYGIALELYKLSPLPNIVKLLNISTKFMELDQKNTKKEPNTDLLEHYLKCTFLRSMIVVTEARNEKKSTRKERHYREAREAIKQFQIYIQSLGIDSIIKSHEHTWLDRYRIILSFDFEAAVHLHQWGDLTTIIETSNPVVGAKLSSVFLDCLLRSGAPSSYLSKAVKQIIRTFHSSPSPFLSTNSPNFAEYFPRHLRCLFSLSLQAEEYILAESVLDQALMLARREPDSKSNSNSITYPKDEVQWLATTAFNRAVEFFLISADGDCRRWAGKAIGLADLIGDDRGELGRLLRKNFAKLQPSSKGA